MVEDAVYFQAVIDDLSGERYRLQQAYAKAKAEIEWLRDELEQERQRRRDDLIGQRYRDERLTELQALIDAFVAVDQNPDDTGWDDAYNALLAAATKDTTAGS